MQLGLALPQYDGFSVPARDPLDWPTLLDWAVAAEAKGVGSLWLSDHIVWAIDKYGAAPGNHAGYDPIPTLAAIARKTTTARLGTLVLAPIRPPAVAAKALASLDRLSNGRLTVGLGAGWFEPDFDLIHAEMPPPRQRLEHLERTTQVMRERFAGGPGNLPPPVQQPPPIWFGGKGPKLVELAARVADGWNYCWQATPADLRPRIERLHEHIHANGRDPADFTVSLGIYTLVGEDEDDLRRRFERLKTLAPQGVLDGATLQDYRHGRLVGTVEQVREQVQEWEEVGVAIVIACLGAVPFSVTELDDLDPVVAAVH